MIDITPMDPWNWFIQSWEDIGRNAARNIVKWMTADRINWESMHGMRLRKA